MSGQYALYRYFDATDRLLYVGKSGDVAARNSTHIRSSQWMQFAASSAIERYDTPEVLGEAERKAIQAEGPVFNRQYNDTPEARARLRAYLEEVGRLDLMPARLKGMPGAERVNMRDLLSDGEAEDVIDFLRQILTADTADHANVRLWALAAVEGYRDLPRGRKLDRLAELARINRSTAYRAKKGVLSRPA